MELASCVQTSLKEEGTLSSAHKASSQPVPLRRANPHHGVAERLGNASPGGGGSGGGGGGGQQRCQSAPLALTTHDRSSPSPGASGPKRKRAATPEAQELLQSSRTGPLNLSKAPRRDDGPEGRNDGGLSLDGRRSVPPATSLRRPSDGHSGGGGGGGGGGGADLAATPGCHGDGPSATPCCHGAGASWLVVQADDPRLRHGGATAVLQLQQQMRPSVITCAPALSQKNHHGSRHASRGPNKSHKRPDAPAESDAPAASDPVVEEHFRRSLGKDYREADSVSITGSVDDHFAKALGDAWFQLKTTSTATAAGEGRSAPRPDAAAKESGGPARPGEAGGAAGRPPAPSPSPASTDASATANASGTRSESDAEETPVSPRAANHAAAAAAAPAERVPAPAASPPGVS